MNIADHCLTHAGRRNVDVSGYPPKPCSVIEARVLAFKCSIFVVRCMAPLKDALNISEPTQAQPVWQQVLERERGRAGCSLRRLPFSAISRLRFLKDLTSRF